MNEIIAISSVLFFAGWILAACRAGKEFLFVFGTFSVVASNALFGYEVSIFGMVTTWAVFAYCLNFLAINCLTEFYSKKDAYNYVINMAVIQLLFCLYIVSAGWLDLFGGQNYKQAVEQLYSITPRITLAAIVAHLLLFIDASVYRYFKDHGVGWMKELWFRATLSALVSHLVINIVFFTIAFYGVIPGQTLMQIILSNILIKYVISLAETPLMYAARWVMNQKKVLNYEI